MKKFLKNAGLQIGVFALAIGAAFATNAMKNAEMQVTDRIGYYRLVEGNTSPCNVTNVMCTTITNPVLCTWFDVSSGKEHNLYELEGTSCPNKLYKKN
ncbi:DUF6520 family protein [Myroides indicus]|uniref:DUF333 domain-containing protein n=1 Tax=Myroides indicus TaxID=1323422 RepID=A0A4R7ESK8_9FLAO|nr:DUF6520 family protein [Myroides indicus]TDS52426.1 hypothetical protein C8P70_13117 [Myroides indicus]